MAKKLIKYPYEKPLSETGDVLNGNVYQTDILDLIRAYRP